MYWSFTASLLYNVSDIWSPWSNDSASSFWSHAASLPVVLEPYCSLCGAGALLLPLHHEVIFDLPDQMNLQVASEVTLLLYLLCWSFAASSASCVGWSDIWSPWSNESASSFWSHTTSLPAVFRAKLLPLHHDLICLIKWVWWNDIWSPWSNESASSFWSHTTSLLAVMAAIYLASAVLSATELCFLLIQNITADPMLKQHPLVFFLSTALLAQSESVYLCRFSPSSAVYLRPYPTVPFKYTRMCFAAIQSIMSKLDHELAQCTFCKTSAGFTRYIKDPISCLYIVGSTNSESEVASSGSPL